MPIAMRSVDTRQEIVETANEAFYHQGFVATSLSDIARRSGIPKGNFYHYFRSKNEILDAVIDFRVERIRAMLADWDREFPTPRERLLRFSGILLNERDSVLRYGCPMGTLNSELVKSQMAQASRAAEMFTVFQKWLQEQFSGLGYSEEAKPMALMLLAQTQGVSLVASVRKDESLLQREVERLQAWINSL